MMILNVIYDFLIHHHSLRGHIRPINENKVDFLKIFNEILALLSHKLLVGSKSVQTSSSKPGLRHDQNDVTLIIMSVVYVLVKQIHYF